MNELEQETNQETLNRLIVEMHNKVTSDIFSDVLNLCSYYGIDHNNKVIGLMTDYRERAKQASNRYRQLLCRQKELEVLLEDWLTTTDENGFPLLLALTRNALKNSVKIDHEQYSRDTCLKQKYAYAIK